MANEPSQEIDLDLSGFNTHEIVHLKQGDKGKVITGYLKNGTVKYTPNPTSIVWLSMQKSRGTKVEIKSDDTDPQIFLNEDVVTIYCTEQMTVLKGHYIADVWIVDDDKRYGTATFTIDIEEAAVNPNSIDSMDEIPAILSIMNDANTLKTNLANMETTYSPRLTTVETEVSNARGTYSNVKARLDNTDQLLAANANDLLRRAVNIKYPPLPLVGAVGDGATDDTVAIQNLLNVYNAVYIPIGFTFIVTKLTLKTNAVICGEGYKSVLKQKSNTSSHFLLLENSDTALVRLINFRCVGNKANQTATNDCVYFANATSQTTVDGTSLVDHYHIIKDVHIEDFTGNGVYTYHCRQIHLDNVTSRGNLNGFKFEESSDSTITNCTAAVNTNGFWNYLGGNLRFIGCKAFFNTTGFKHTNSYIYANTSYTGCETQSNTEVGFDLANATLVTLSNCVFDSDPTPLRLGAISYCNIDAVIRYFADWLPAGTTPLTVIGTIKNCNIVLSILKTSTTDFALINNTSGILKMSSDVLINGTRGWLGCDLTGFDYLTSRANKLINNFAISLNHVTATSVFNTLKQNIITISANEAITNYGECTIRRDITKGGITRLQVSARIKTDASNATRLIKIVSCASDNTELSNNVVYVADNSINYCLHTVNTSATYIKILIGINTPQTLSLNAYAGKTVTISDIDIEAD